MLVLTRRIDESLIVGDDIKITVVKIDNTQIKLGIEAPKDVTIEREEVLKETNKERALSYTSNTINQSFHNNKGVNQMKKLFFVKLLPSVLNPCRYQYFFEVKAKAYFHLYD